MTKRWGITVVYKPERIIIFGGGPGGLATGHEGCRWVFARGDCIKGGGRGICSYDDRPAAQNFLSQYKNLVHHFYHHRGRTGSSYFWAGCGAIRRQAFLEMGGFDVEKHKRPSIQQLCICIRIS